MLSFGAPPSSSSATRAIASFINAFNERSDALPFGREALKRLGGVEQINEKAINAADAFIIERFFLTKLNNTHNFLASSYYITLQKTPNSTK